MSEEIAAQVEEEEGAPLWVVTFGDLMSLLLCFFVLMLSFSEQDRKKYRMVSGSMNRAFGIQRKIPVFESPKGQKIIAREFDQAILIAKIENELMDPVEREKLNRIGNAKELFEIEATEEEVTIRLMGETTFDLGRAEIRPAFRSLLLKVGTLLKDTKGDILITGHTDNVPLKGGQFRSNLGLSIARAGSVAQFFLERLRIEPARISTMGFGEHRPIATNNTARGRQKNRRVEIVLIK